MSIAYMILDFRKTQTILEIKESTENQFNVPFPWYYIFGVLMSNTLFWFSPSAHLKIVTVNHPTTIRTRKFWITLKKCDIVKKDKSNSRRLLNRNCINHGKKVFKNSDRKAPSRKVMSLGNHLKGTMMKREPKRRNWKESMDSQYRMVPRGLSKLVRKY